MNSAEIRYEFGMSNYGRIEISATMSGQETVSELQEQLIEQLNIKFSQILEQFNAQQKETK